MAELKEPTADALMSRLPRGLAQAYQRALKAGSAHERHDGLLDLGKATVKYVGMIVRAEYLLRREGGQADEKVEALLSELRDKGKPSFGDNATLALAYWRSLEQSAILQPLPLGKSRRRMAIKDFVGSWDAIKEIWTTHPEPKAHRHLNYDALVPLVRKDGKESQGNTSLSTFFFALVNCRNAGSHAEDFEVGGKRLKLEFGDSYYACINPVLQTALDELLSEFVAALGDHTEHRVKLIEGNPDGSREAHLLRHRGLREIPHIVAGAPESLVKESRWLLNGDGQPVLQLENDLPAPLAPPATTQPEAPAGPHSASPPPGRSTPGVDRVPFNVPFRSKRDTFVGRDDLLAQVHDLLEAGRRTVVGQAANIHGLGGIGKTQLAVEYAHRYRDQYANGVVWFTANEPLEPQLASFSVRELGYPDEDKQENLVGLARQWLDSHEAYLLVLDNVDAGQDMDRLLPGRSQPRILVTSRHELPPPYEPVRLEELSPEHARTLLLQTAGLDANDPGLDASSLDQLCEELCNFPLALELAGSYLREHRKVTSVAQYLDMFRRKGLDAHGLDTKTPTPGTRHVASVKATLALNRDVLQDTHGVLLLVEIMAMWPVRSVSRGLLVEMAGIEDMDDARHLVGGAVNMSLLRLSEDGRVQIHPFLQEVEKQRLSTRNNPEFHRCMAQGATKWLAIESTYEDSRPISADFDGLNELARGSRELGFDGVWPELYRFLGLHLLSVGQTNRARRQYLEPALDEALSNFTDAVAIAQYRLSLAQALELQARYSDALDLVGQVLELDTDGYAGTDSAGSKTMAAALSSSTTINVRLGRLEAAEKQGERALGFCTKAFGPDALRTAEAHNDLGLVYHHKVKYEAALEQYNIAWRIRGTDSRCSLSAFLQTGNCIANTLSALGRERDALFFHRSVLERGLPVFGTNHPFTAVALSNLGGALALTGQYEESRHHLERAQRFFRLHTKELPLESCACLVALGQTLDALNKPTRALAYKHAALDTALAELGHQHPKTADIHYSLGITLGSLGSLDEAILHFRKASSIAKKSLGKRHPKTAQYNQQLQHVSEVMSHISAQQRPSQGVLPATPGKTTTEEEKLSRRTRKPAKSAKRKRGKKRRQK